MVLLNDTFHLTLLPTLLVAATALLVWWEAWSIAAAAALYAATAALTWDFFRRPRKS